MPKDYARSHRRSAAQTDGGAPPPTPDWASKSTVFLAGSVFGAVVTFVVLVGVPGPWRSLLPGPAEEAPVAAQTTPAESAEPDESDASGYGFFDRLRNANVNADVAPYEELSPTAGAPREFVIQTASFTRVEDAEKLRGELILRGMQATLDGVEVAGRGPRYRVLVGPFETRLKAGSAMNRLRETGLDPLLLSREPTNP